MRTIQLDNIDNLDNAEKEIKDLIDKLCGSLENEGITLKEIKQSLDSIHIALNEFEEELRLEAGIKRITQYNQNEISYYF